MNEHLDPTTQQFSQEELDIERALRPVTFDDFTGQEQVLENLKVFVVFVVSYVSYNLSHLI